MEEKKETTKKLDVSFYVAKFGVPLLENKWIIIIFFVAGLLITLLLSSFIKPQFISGTALQIEQPFNEAMSIRQGTMSPRKAKAPYVIAVEEKLKSKSFAKEVLKILPDDVKLDLELPLDLRSQILAGLRNLVRTILGRSKKSDDKKESPSSTPDEDNRYLQELEKRVGIRVNSNIAMVWITGATLEKNLAPILVKSYLDVLLAMNLEENKKGVQGKISFTLEQKNAAQQTFEKAEQALVKFRNHYQIPADLKMTPDTEIQAQLNTLLSNYEVAKEHYDRLDRIYLEARVREAGVLVNIHVLSAPMIPLRPSKSAKQKVLLVGVMMSLAVGLAIVLIFDFLKGPIRHEKDINDAVHLPIYGSIPSL
ncbi:MAG: hypothetical protein HN366_20875 [Deltaproteobacteria bacterium]|nr:hypothetical protein [Deltaproteobacteria bacterium]